MTDPDEKRILFAVGRLWGDEGITARLVTLTKALQARGWEVGLVAGVDPDAESGHTNLHWLRENTDFYPARFPELRLSVSALARGLQSLLVFKRALDTFRPSVVHSHSLSLSPYLFLLRGMYDVPVVATCHIAFADDRRDVDLATYLTALFPSYLGNKLIAISTEMKRLFVSELGVPEHRIALIPHGVDDDRFRPPTEEERASARDEFGLDANDRVVCLVGRLDPIKGHEVLFDALQSLEADGTTVHALCAGTGGYADEIERAAQARGLGDRVQFPGYVDARTVYWASDVNVLPSEREGFGLVVPEAMLCGIPTARTPAAGAHDQIVDGENGFLIPFDAPDELTDRLDLLFSNPEQRNRMGAAAAETAKQRFTLDRSINQTEALYDALRTE